MNDFMHRLLFSMANNSFVRYIHIHDYLHDYMIYNINNG